MLRGTWRSLVMLPSCSLLLAACGQKALIVHPAEPEPAPKIETPQILKEPVERPSWMPPRIAVLLGYPMDT